MLENVSIFANVPEKQLQELEKISVVRNYPKNTILFMEGDENNQLFIIQSGKVSVYVNGDDGKQVILNFMSDGEYFGELSLLDRKPRSASVMTVTDCRFMTISRANFQQFLEDNPVFSLNIMEGLVSKVRELTGNVKNLALLDVYGRVADVLTRLSDGDNCIANPKMTHQDIANMVGASREMVSRIMKELIVGGYIEQSSNAIQIKKEFPKGW